MTNLQKSSHKELQQLLGQRSRGALRKTPSKKWDSFHFHRRRLVLKCSNARFTHSIQSCLQNNVTSNSHSYATTAQRLHDKLSTSLTHSLLVVTHSTNTWHAQATGGHPSGWVSQNFVSMRCLQLAAFSIYTTQCVQRPCYWAAGECVVMCPTFPTDRLQRVSSLRSTGDRICEIVVNFVKDSTTWISSCYTAMYLHQCMLSNIRNRKNLGTDITNLHQWHI